MRTVYVLAVAVLSSACTATVDKQSSRRPRPPGVDAGGGRAHPYDPSLPYYVVTVEPLSFDAGGEGGGSAPPFPGAGTDGGLGLGLLPRAAGAAYNPPPQGASGNMGSAIASQLVTALSNAATCASSTTTTISRTRTGRLTWRRKASVRSGRS